MQEKILEEMRTQIELIYYAPSEEQIEFEYGYTIGMLRAARIGKLMPDKTINHYVDEACNARKQRIEELIAKTL